MWDNQPNELNDGPACRCSLKARKIGIRHGIYEGENEIPKVELDMNTNNADKLYHYRVTISPNTNFLADKPTIIAFDEHEFIFEGNFFKMHLKNTLTVIWQEHGTSCLPPNSKTVFLCF